MNFMEYLNHLCVTGIIDGNIAQMLASKHEAEAANPFPVFRKTVQGLLDEMWATRHDVHSVAEYADRFDDYIELFELGGVRPYDDVRKRNV